MNEQEKKIHLSVIHIEAETEELGIAGFDEVETPEADTVSLGSASYTKMLGKIWA